MKILQNLERTRFVWTAGMKFLDCERGVSQVDSGLPGVLRIIVAYPIHEIVQLAAPKLGVEDLVNLELGSPSTSVGKGGGTTRPENVFTTCSSSRLTWNIGWIFMDRGSSSL